MRAGLKMHDGEVETSAALVRRLLMRQFPRWAGLPIAAVPSAGTDHAIYRLGADLSVRLPRIDWAVGQAAKERQWLPRFAPFLPLRLPEALAQGEPDEGYPWPWAIYRWLEGENATTAAVDQPAAAGEMARFLTALQQIDPTGGPPAGGHGLRGAPLAGRDAAVRQAIAALEGTIDTAAATAVWEEALRAAEWDRAPVWFHGDLLSGNVLVRDGRLSAVIDWGGAGVGDPACDLMIAWSLFSGAGRAALGVDDATWARGRGQALAQAVIFIPYYVHTNPVGVASARRALSALLADYERP